MPFVLQMLAARADAPVDAARASSAVAMFIALAFLLGIFMTGLILLWAARRARREAERKKTSDPASDPWQEAGRRAEPVAPDQNAD